jgi:hypothetical protein
MTLTVTKIYDYGCPVCEFMGTFDGKVIFDLDPPTNMKAVALGNLLDPSNEKPFENLLAQLVERYACNPDYTVDLPVYMVTQGKSYVGHVVGEHVQNQLKIKLQGIVTNATNTES